ncbi:hypothetical protein SDC9_199951 [bioreactor metagenome]|uniref:Uncharacterized protein n=1 Tax=bioreactor metagenome TaxID=1076179 RepID=A0A645ILV3_9ZZZZ
MADGARYAITDDALSHKAARRIVHDNDIRIVRHKRQRIPHRILALFATVTDNDRFAAPDIFFYFTFDDITFFFLTSYDNV